MFSWCPRRGERLNKWATGALAFALSMLGMAPTPLGALSRARAEQVAVGIERPFGDSPVGYNAATSTLRVAASGLSDGRGRLVGQSVRARAMAEARALRRLQQYVDAILERAGVAPQVAERVHAALGSAVKVVATRVLSDGSVVVMMDVPVGRLIKAWPEGKDAWAR